MGTVKFSWLAGFGVVAAIAGWVVNWWANRNGFPPPTLHLSSLLTVAAILTITLIFGFRVLRWRNGRRDRVLNPILAARTVVLAQATAYAGALNTGWHLGILVDQLSLVAVRGVTGSLWGTLVLAGSGIVMIVVGLVVQGFCRLPPDDEADGLDRNGRRNDEGEYA
ncbi:hypothetical protein IWX64_001768 [Arthrobacter sp. CAN_A212]|uniref:DUF3180 domain-containing protein n=1 Tax=unclassified Arthrobacter TaxID=235627 RepID=UPI0018CB9E0E|nr:DUF3180 domain-containing protein [Arthrobacter sp. CAN_C5]MBP2218447.1 hypothetical protein [Arthrobacter sp. CAN_C5]